MGAAQRKRCFVRKSDTLTGIVPVLNFPICGPNPSIFVKLYFWTSLVVVKYILTAWLYWIYLFPYRFKELNAAILGNIASLISVYFVIIYRKETRNLLRDACDRLHSVTPDRLLRINFCFKVGIVLYFVYSLIVVMLELMADTTVVMRSNQLNDSTYARILTFQPDLNASAGSQTFWTFAGIIAQTASGTALNGYVVILLSYLLAVLVGLCDYIVQLLDRTRFRQIDVLNDNLLAFVTLVNRVNSLLKNLLLLWYVVALYNGCDSVVTYIYLLDEQSAASLTMHLPCLFRDIINVTILTFAASRIPEALDRVSECLFALSKEALASDRDREYLFLKAQFKFGDVGLKIGGMFLMTKNLFVSFLGLGLTYAVVYIQLNPSVMNKLQGTS